MGMDQVEPPRRGGAVDEEGESRLSKKPGEPEYRNLVKRHPPPACAPLIGQDVDLDPFLARKPFPKFESKGLGAAEQAVFGNHHRHPDRGVGLATGKPMDGCLGREYLLRRHRPSPDPPGASFPATPAFQEEQYSISRSLTYRAKRA